MDGIKGQKNKALLTTHSEEETRQFGKKFSQLLQKNSVVCFFGDLGAGKTTFIKGLASALTGCLQEEINSPTYTYLNIYSGVTSVYHFDLYRLETSEDFLHMGFDDFFYADGICCIEWSERIQELLPEKVWHVKLTHIAPNQRQIEWFLGKSHER